MNIEASYYDKQRTQDEQIATDNAEKSIRKRGEEYQSRLPYKVDTPKIPESLTTALYRLRCTERKIVKWGILDRYSQQLQSFVAKSYTTK
jgi:hypothetical protein